MQLLKYLPVTVLLSLSGLSFLRGGSGPNKLQRDVPDAFKAFAAFPYVIGMTDSNNDSIFECLTALRKDLDPESKTVTYVWSLNGGPEHPRNHQEIHYTQGETPDTANVKFGKDDEVADVKYVRYTDYKDCIVTETAYFSEQCTLWVSKEVEDMVPEHCTEQFEDICGMAAPLHPADVCEDDYTDSED